MGRPIILVSNDDGIHAPGLVGLAEALEAVGTVYVVAPDRERSTVGHALTLHRPLRVDQIAARRYRINGTPSDCVNLGILGILPSRPSLVVAGVNNGGNLGDDVTYSGTVSAAMEGTLLGIPSVAISLVSDDGAGLQPAVRFGVALASLMLSKGIPKDTLLNVNVPTEPTGVKVTKLGRRTYSEKVVEETDPRGKRYYWIGAGPPLWEPGEETDFAAIQKGLISITPLHLDLTNYQALEALRGWESRFSSPRRRPRPRRASP
jgi:5'-nucleotidase